MSAPSLRRYRAERLLRRDFRRLREEVLPLTLARLRARGATIDEGDLDACYAQAWQGLYSAMLEGEEVESPVAWLTVVTYRRAIDELRSRGRERRRALAGVAAGGPSEEPDLAQALDDQRRLRELMEGLRGRLSERERQAAALCYLQGLTRAQAAARMGLSEARMNKLMEGRGDGRPGVARKVGDLLDVIGEGGWCDEQASLMRGLAFGILDPEGERYRLAVAHRRECPACRAYVRRLRGLAAVLPAPLPLGMAGGRSGAGGSAARRPLPRWAGSARPSAAVKGTAATLAVVGAAAVALIVPGHGSSAPPGKRAGGSSAAASSPSPPVSAAHRTAAPAAAAHHKRSRSARRSTRLAAAGALREYSPEQARAEAAGTGGASSGAGTGSGAPRGAGREFGLE